MEYSWWNNINKDVELNIMVDPGNINFKFRKEIQRDLKQVPIDVNILQET